MKSPWPEIGKRLFTARDGRGLSQKKLADLVGCSPTSICLLELGKSPVSEPLLRALELRLKIDLLAGLQLPKFGYPNKTAISALKSAEVAYKVAISVKDNAVTAKANGGSITKIEIGENMAPSPVSNLFAELKNFVFEALQRAEKDCQKAFDAAIEVAAKKAYEAGRAEVSKAALNTAARRLQEFIDEEYEKAN